MEAKVRLSGVFSLALLTAAGASALLMLAGPGLAEVAQLAGDPLAWVAERGSDHAVAALAAVGAWAVVVYLALGVAVTALSHVRGALGATSAVLSRRWVPGSVRRLAELALGTAVVAGSLVAPAGPAAAAAAPSSSVAPAPADRQWPGMSPHSDDSGRLRLVVTGAPAAEPDESASPKPGPIAPVPEIATEPALPAITPGWSPDWPPAGSSATALPTEPSDGVRGQAAGPVVVVRCGDTLWSLAERHLDAEASDAQIQAEWQRWHAVNRAVIGTDPNSIRPGQRLLPPARS